MSAAEDRSVLLLQHPEPDPVMVQWARFRDQFAVAVEGTLYTIEEVEQSIARREAVLFAGKQSAVVAEARDGVMQLMWACGEIEELVTLLPGIEAVARMKGCMRMMVEGPRGWERVLKAAGYGFYSVTLSKEL